MRERITNTSHEVQHKGRLLAHLPCTTIPSGMTHVAILGPRPIRKLVLRRCFGLDIQPY